MPGHIIVTENQAISANRYRHASELLSDMEDLRWVVGMLPELGIVVHLGD
jgi:hypothetical protein